MDTSLPTKIRTVVQGLIAKYQWSLLTEAELVACISEQLNTGEDGSEPEVRKFGIGCYSERLFEIICRDGAEDEDRASNLNRAFKELEIYLFMSSLHMADGDRDLAAEFTQDALVRIWEQREKCTNSRTFLRFCLYRLQHARTYYLRDKEKSRRTDPMPDPDDSESTSGMELEAQETQQPEQQTLCKESKVGFHNRFHQIGQEQPRAKRQLAVVYLSEILSYLEEKEPLTDEEIATIVETPVKNVPVLRSRGKKILRQDDDLQAILGQIRRFCAG